MFVIFLMFMMIAFAVSALVIVYYKSLNSVNLIRMC